MEKQSAATTGNLATLLSALTGCTTAAYAYVPKDNACEALGSGGGTEVKVNGGSALTTSNQTGVLPYLCADTSGSGTAQSCTTTPGFTPQLGNCLSYTTTTESGSSLTLNMNGSGAYEVQIPSPSGWAGVYAAGQILPGTTYTACYYVNGDDTPLWNVQ